MSQPQPSIADIRNMWNELILIPKIDLHNELELLITTLRNSHTNGGAEFTSFHYYFHPTLDWFIRTRRLTLPNFDFSSEFLTHQVVREKLKAIQIPPKLSDPLNIQVMDIFDVEAAMLRTVVCGGAYAQFSGKLSEARNIVGGFLDVVASGWQNQWFGYIGGPWTDWFHDVSWDQTWIGLNTATQTMWILCVTDSD